MKRESRSNKGKNGNKVTERERQRNRLKARNKIIKPPTRRKRNDKR